MTLLAEVVKHPDGTGVVWRWVRVVGTISARSAGSSRGLVIPVVLHTLSECALDLYY